MSDFLINELDPCKIFILVDWKIFSVHEALAVLNEAAKPKKRDLNRKFNGRKNYRFFIS